MGEVSMGLTGDEDMITVPSVPQFLFCFFSLHTNWSMKWKETHHTSRDAQDMGVEQSAAVKTGRQSVPIFLSSLCSINSFSAENEDEIAALQKPLCSVSFLLRGRKLSLQCSHHRWPPPSVTSPQLSPCKQILSGFRSKSLINKCCVQLCT